MGEDEQHWPKRIRLKYFHEQNIVRRLGTSKKRLRGIAVYPDSR